jgi:hypothetical protein
MTTTPDDPNPLPNEVPDSLPAEPNIDAPDPETGLEGN